MSWTRFVVAVAIACAACSLRATDARAQLTEANVLLLYNSENAESLAVRNAYIAARPGVLEFDLDLAYPHLEPNDPQPSGIPIEGINNQFISPEKFVEIFLDPGPYQTFLAAHPEILAIATTRGLPAAVSTDFDPPPVLTSSPIHASFEAALASNRNSGTGGAIVLTRPNEYHGYFMPFSDYLARCNVQSSEGEMPGSMFLAVRIDAGLDGAATSDLIARSVPTPPINPFLAWAVLDGDGGAGTTSLRVSSETTALLSQLYHVGFCVHRDNGLEFRHGPSDPQFSAATDGPFTSDYPTVFLATQGRHHSTSLETHTPRYVERFAATSMGFFYSFESFNGWELHSPVTSTNGNGVGQGNGVDWTSYAGGSFAIVNVQEPILASLPNSSAFVRAFHGMGLTFAEAAYVFLDDFHVQTPIGDPLARVEIWNPDVNGDHKVDLLDRALVAARDPSADINGDGVVDTADDAIINVTPDRDCSISPTPSVPGSVPTPPDASASYMNCYGDVNGDSRVDFADLSLVSAALGSVCPPADLDGMNGVTFGDLNVLMNNYNQYWPDVDQSSLVDCLDAQLVLAAVGLTASDPGFNPRYDMTCDGVIDCTDWLLVAALADGPGLCGQSCP